VEEDVVTLFRECKNILVITGEDLEGFFSFYSIVLGAGISVSCGVKEHLRIPL